MLITYPYHAEDHSGDLMSLRNEIRRDWKWGNKRRKVKNLVEERAIIG
jgi:hypothetical protein